MLKKIYHLGYAVEDLEAAARFYKEHFGIFIGEPEEVEEQGVVTTMFDVGESKIELLEPTRPDSPVGKFLAQRGEVFTTSPFSWTISRRPWRSLKGVALSL